ncbi:MAG: hypothetical protein WCB31_12710 [Nitrososphaeraceae archaeon]
MVSSLPEGMGHLDLKKEIEAVKNELLGSKYSQQFKIISVENVSRSELIKLILKNHPRIFHFTGFGNQEGLFFKNQLGVPELLSPEETTDLFRTLKESENLNLVVLNTCNSHDIAKNLNRYVNCTIGISGFIHDNAAIAFAEYFYMSIFSGKSIKDSFNVATTQLGLTYGNTESMPQIFSKKGFNPSKFYISDMIQNKSDNEKDDDNSLPILKKVTDINQKMKDSYMNTIKGNTDILNFYSEVQPLITEIVLDDKINEEIGEEEISSLNDLLINLNTQVSSMKKEDNIGHITQANIFRNQAMDVATKMVRKFNIINHIVKA